MTRAQNLAVGLVAGAILVAIAYAVSPLVAAVVL